MSIVGLIVAIAIVAVLVWLAPKLPAPFPIVVYAVVVIILIVYLLAVTGLIGSPIVLRS